MSFFPAKGDNSASPDPLGATSSWGKREMGAGAEKERKERDGRKHP